MPDWEEKAKEVYDRIREKDPAELHVEVWERIRDKVKRTDTPIFQSSHTVPGFFRPLSLLSALGREERTGILFEPEDRLFTGAAWNTPDLTERPKKDLKALLEAREYRVVFLDAVAPGGVNLLYRIVLRRTL